jgi:Cu+-exporting ATPase
MRVGPSSFTPSVIKIKAGVPVEWVIIGENPSGCTNRIIVPGTDLSVPVRKGSRQTVAFTAPEPGTIAFSCWMSMVHGKFIVE